MWQVNNGKELHGVLEPYTVQWVGTGSKCWWLIVFPLTFCDGWGPKGIDSTRKKIQPRILVILKAITSRFNYWQQMLTLVERPEAKHKMMTRKSTLDPIPQSLLHTEFSLALLWIYDDLSSKDQSVEKFCETWTPDLWKIFYFLPFVPIYWIKNSSGQQQCKFFQALMFVFINWKFMTRSLAMLAM